MQVILPQFFCLDSADNIIISDWIANKVKVFTKEGNLIKTIGNAEQQAGMFYNLQ